MIEWSPSELAKLLDPQGTRIWLPDRLPGRSSGGGMKRGAEHTDEEILQHYRKWLSKFQNHRYFHAFCYEWPGFGYWIGVYWYKPEYIAPAVKKYAACQFARSAAQRALVRGSWCCKDVAQLIGDYIWNTRLEDEWTKPK
jgi:hypothetical protein